MPKKEPSQTQSSKKELEACRSEIDRLNGLIAALSEERDYFSRIFDNANDGIIIHDEQGRIFEVNKTYHQRLGYDKSEMLKMPLSELVPKEFADLIPRRMRVLRKNGSAIFESQDRRKDGTIMPVEVSATYVNFLGRKVIQAVVRDIHKHKLAEELIRATMKDNTRLTKEIQRQSRYVSDVFSKILGRMVQDIESGNHRRSLITALDHQCVRLGNIALIQKMLYKSPVTGLIDIEGPIRKLLPFNFHQLGISPCRISPNIDVSVISMDLSRAVPCCQLVAELLTNALQHAFPKNIPGEIEIRLTQKARGGYVLVVADTGVGVPKGFRIKRSGTLGMQLVLDLVSQLEGRIEVRRDIGTRFIVRFG
jgi:PAS domain S-box-containing protein